MKICTKCKIEKEEIEFYFRSDTQKYKNNCKECEINRIKQYSEKNKEKIKEYQKQYFTENKEQKRKYDKSYRERNRDRDEENKRQYYFKNKKKIRQYRNLWEKQKRQTDLCYKLRCNVKNLIRLALTKNGQSKGGRSITKYLPYSIQDLKQHLESQFEDWMTWENYGSLSSKKLTWQIDHIIPQSILIYDNMEHPNFQKCWALENLRPLSSVENARKGNKVEC